MKCPQPTPVHPAPSLAVQAFKDGLEYELRQCEGASRADEPRWSIDVVPRAGSTNTEAVAEVRSGARGAYSALIALDQVAGKGRLDRQWEAPAGSSLFCSMVVPMVADSAQWGVMPLIAGLAVQRGLSAIAREAASPRSGTTAATRSVAPPGLMSSVAGRGARGADIDRHSDATSVPTVTRVTLKWPNDVLVCGGDATEPLKVCGILLETVQNMAVIGVGINVSQTQDQIPFPQATSLALCGLAVSREQVAAAVLGQVGEMWPLLETQLGRDQALNEYRRFCDTVGRPVRVFLDENTSIEGQACGIADDGELLVDVAGVVRHFASGDVYHLR